MKRGELIVTTAWRTVSEQLSIFIFFFRLLSSPIFSPQAQSQRNRKSILRRKSASQIPLLVTLNYRVGLLPKCQWRIQMDMDQVRRLHNTLFTSVVHVPNFSPIFALYFCCVTVSVGICFFQNLCQVQIPMGLMAVVVVQWV